MIFVSAVHTHGNSTIDILLLVLSFLDIQCFTKHLTFLLYPMSYLSYLCYPLEGTRKKDQQQIQEPTQAFEKSIRPARS